MSSHLTLLALASAAMLALPVVGHADPSLDLVENSLGGWTPVGVGFYNASTDNFAVGAAGSQVAGLFSPDTSVAFTGAQAANATTTADDASGSGFVAVSATSSAVIAGLDDAISVNGPTTAFSGTMNLGESLASYANPHAAGAGNVASAADRGGVRPLAVAGGTIDIHTSAPHESAYVVLLGAGLLGLGAAFRRRRLHRTAPMEAGS